MLAQRGLNDLVLHNDVPVRVQQRLAIAREELDKQLHGTTGGGLQTQLKNWMHAGGALMK